MISEDSLKTISKIFCGDIEGFYSYKTGPQLVAFFNKYYNTTDKYGNGFPSRWIYVYNKLANLLNSASFDSFLNVILKEEYIMQDNDMSKVKAAEQARIILKEFQRIVQKDLYIIINKNNGYHLCKENDDLVIVGSGGFANVYEQKSTGLIIKKLKDEHLANKGIRSRFKREFNITSSLQDMHGIIKVYDYNMSDCSYTMEKAERTLSNYIQNFTITDDIRLNCIRQVLGIMTEVHKRDIVHRDLSPTNIFIIAGLLKIGDFGLGKDLNVFTSHQTINSNSFGQYYYCAPEQFMLLKDGDKRSDVYSLGRIINFIMTGNPNNSNHVYRNVTEKATNSNSAYRYADAGQLSKFFEKSVLYHNDEKNKQLVLGKIANIIFDDDVEEYIYELNPSQLSTMLLNKCIGINEALISFMKCDEKHAEHIIQSIDSSYVDVCKGFDNYDCFAGFAYKVLKEDFNYVVKETAAHILRYVAVDINRFYAQHLVESIIENGIEPLLEDILNT